MPNRIETVTVTGTANSLTTDSIITSNQIGNKTVTRLWVTEVTGTLQHDATISVFINREELVNFPYVHFLTDSDADDRNYLPVIDLNIDVPEGQTLIVGHTSGSTASDFKYSVEYTLG